MDAEKITDAATIVFYQPGREGTRLFVQHSKVEGDRRINGFPLGFKRHIRDERPALFLIDIQPVLAFLVFTYREKWRAVDRCFLVSVVFVENADLPTGNGETMGLEIPNPDPILD